MKPKWLFSLPCMHATKNCTETFMFTRVSGLPWPMLRRQFIIIYHLCISCLQASRTPADWCLRHSWWFWGEITKIIVESNHTRTCSEVFLVTTLYQTRLKRDPRSLVTGNNILRDTIRSRTLSSNRSRVFWIYLNKAKRPRFDKPWAFYE